MFEATAASGSFWSWLRAHSATIAKTACALFALLVATLEFLTPPGMEWTLCHLLLISFAAWIAGWRAGFLAAAACILLVLIREFQVVDNRVPGWTACWNVGTEAGSYLLVGVLVAGLRNVTTDLKWKVGERTAAWQREVADRTTTEEQLHKTLQQLRQLADNMTDVFWMREAGGIRFGYVSPAYERIWGRSARELYQRPEAWLEAIHTEDRERIGRMLFNSETNAAYDVEYRIQRADGSMRWIRERAFPIRDGAGRLVRIVGIAEDTTDHRRLEREIIEVSDREHARIGQDLHDGLCQKLIALAFDCRTLEQKLAIHDVPERDSARRMSAFVEELILEARATARGLFPVQLETDGLADALQQLAETASSRLKVDLQIEPAKPGAAIEVSKATHLYRIAQEALNNAVKHSNATTVTACLAITEGRVELRIADNGVGLAHPHKGKGGMGLHIMEYRARMIGGTLSVSPGPHGGTVVSCVAPLTST